MNAPAFHLSVDEYHRWRVFNVKDALGEFGTWDDADRFRKSLVVQDAGDIAPAWNPKSGGY